MIIFYFFIWFFVAMLAIGIYIVTALSLYGIAQRKGIDHAYLAWIPIAQDYLFAEIIGSEIKVKDTKIPYFPWLYVGVIYLGNAVFTALAVIPVIGWILRLLSAPLIYVVCIYVQYRFFKLFEGGNEVVFTVLSAIFPVVRPFLLLYLRNKPFVIEPNYTDYTA